MQTTRKAGQCARTRRSKGGRLCWTRAAQEQGAASPQHARMAVGGLAACDRQPCSRRLSRPCTVVSTPRSTRVPRPASPAAASHALTGLLRVVVRPHFVDPQRHGVTHLILHMVTRGGVHTSGVGDSAAWLVGPVRPAGPISTSWLLHSSAPQLQSSLEQAMHGGSQPTCNRELAAGGRQAAAAVQQGAGAGDRHRPGGR